MRPVLLLAIGGYGAGITPIVWLPAHPGDREAEFDAAATKYGVPSAMVIFAILEESC